MINDPTGITLNVGNPISVPQLPNINITNSIVNGSTYPVWSTGGGPTNCVYCDVPITTFATCFGPYEFSSIVIIRGQLARWPVGEWPAGSNFPEGVSSVGSVNYSGGDYRLCQGPGDPVPSCVLASSYANGGTDGKNPGADIDAIEQATTGVQ